MFEPQTLPICLRPTRDDDWQFLFDVYASTRKEELDAWGWSITERQSFLKMQFKAQEMFYAMQEPKPDDSIVVYHGLRIGRMIIVRTARKIWLAEIMLLPLYRGKGIGGRLIAELQDESTESERPLCCHVLKTNRAFNLYSRMGFSSVSENEMYLLMEYRGW